MGAEKFSLQNTIDESQGGEAPFDPFNVDSTDPTENGRETSSEPEAVDIALLEKVLQKLEQNGISHDDPDFKMLVITRYFEIKHRARLKNPEKQRVFEMWQKGMRWYENLENTKWAGAKEFVDTAMSNAPALLVGSAVGVVPAHSIATRLLLKSGIVAGLRTGTRFLMDKLMSEKTKAKIANFFSYEEKNTSMTEVPEFREEDMDTTEEINNTESKAVAGTISVVEQNINEKIRNLENIRYLAFAGGAGMVFMLSGWIMATIAGVSMLGQHELSKFLKNKIAENEKRIKDLSSKISLHLSPEELVIILNELEEEYRIIQKKINKYKFYRQLGKGAFKFGSNLATSTSDFTDINSSGTTARRFVVEPVKAGVEQIKAEKKKRANE